MKTILRVMAILCGLVAFAQAAGAAPEARLVDAYWALHDESSALSIEHGIWNMLLGRYVARGSDGIARVDYAAFSAPDRDALAGYLMALSQVQPTRLRRVEQRAFWINLYNALTVRAVLEHYPVGSILKIMRSGPFSPGPWKRNLIMLEGRDLSLDDIEHGILRPIWQDPRLHYALNCAALGCPDLAGEAYKVGQADAMLDRAAHIYVNHPRGARVVEGRLTVSKIYKWYARDFGGSDEAAIAHLIRYAGPELRASLEGIDRIAGYGYDWALNDKGGEIKGER